MLKSDYDRILYFIAQIQTDQNSYRETVLTLMHDLFGFNHLTFFLADDRSNFIDPVVINVSSELMNKYMLHYFKTDIFHPYNSLPKLLQKSVLSIQDFMPYREFEKTNYYNELLTIDKFYYELALPLKYGDKILGGIGVLNPKGSGDFNRRDALILNNVGRHISYGLSNQITFSKLEHEKQIYKDSTRQLPIGIIMLDSKFDILNFNDTALELCRTVSDGAPGKDPVPRVVGSILEEIRKQSQSSSSCIEITLGSCRAKISPFVVPGLWNSIDTYYVIYLTEDLSKTGPSLAKIAEYYCWTAREQEIVELIRKGLKNSEIAQKLYISPHTVKTHILNLFQKANVSSRTSLLSTINDFDQNHAAQIPHPQALHFIKK